MLIYTVSLTLQSTMNVTINNQCSNIALTSPVYFIGDAACHIPFPQQTDCMSDMEISFRTDIYQGTFGGALSYHLQRKRNNESGNRADKNTAISAQLLVIWKFRIDRLYAHACLIEHESVLTWDKDMFNTGRLLLDNNTKLQVGCEAPHEKSFKMNVIISEGKHLLHPVKPLWINPNG
jgi:hypothetical protein